MKKRLSIPFCIMITLFNMGCGGNSNSTDKSGNLSLGMDTVIPGIPGNKGIGKFTKVDITTPLNESMVTLGQTVYASKCLTCHKLDHLKLVGPGLKDVTNRRTPEWIMNFCTNPDEMCDKDPTAKAMFEICHVKMPNLNLSDEDTRAILEFLRRNDGGK